MTAPLDVAALLGARVRGLAEYAPEPLEVVSRRLGLPVERLAKLDANENPYGPTPRALEALRAYGAYHQYPDAVSRDLRAALGGYLGVDPAQIVVGNGSDELIDLTLKLFLTPGDVMINCPPTFGVYAFAASLYGARVVDVPRRADFSLDIDAIERGLATGELARAKAIVITSPNNPDGNLPAAAEIERLLALPLLVILDEAYIEFSGPRARRPGAPTREPHQLLVTLSKGWAGQGGGYGVFPRR